MPVMFFIIILGINDEAKYAGTNKMSKIIDVYFLFKMISNKIKKSLCI